MKPVVHGAFIKIGRHYFVDKPNNNNIGQYMLSCTNANDYRHNDLIGIVMNKKLLANKSCACTICTWIRPAIKDILELVLNAEGRGKVKRRGMDRSHVIWALNGNTHCYIQENSQYSNN